MSSTAHDHTYTFDEYGCKNNGRFSRGEEPEDSTTLSTEDHVFHDHSYISIVDSCPDTDVPEYEEEEEDTDEYTCSSSESDEEEPERNGSLLHMKCAQCLNVTLVPTGKRHGQNVWDMNSKLGTAILFCGIGETVVNTLLCALDLPSVSPTTLKKREREAGIALEAVADDTCQDALREEKDRCENSDRAEAVSFEAGWQTRGSGRNYASLTGHGSMIGFNTGKIVAYSYRCKTCRFCQSTKDGPVKEHDCRKNWDKSSKAMESDMAIEMLQDLKQKGFHVKNDYGYDSTTFSRAKAVFDENIEKVCDFNHTKKNFTNRLFELRKEKKYSALGPKAIKHLTKCFAYAVKGNNDRESLESNLCAIPLHVSGDHSKCGNWCGFVQQPSSYKPRNLPYGKYLTGEDLIKDLQHIFDAFSKNAEELLNIGSTQGNESFNNIVFSKKPKEPLLWRLRVHAFRVAAAVAQKNIGNDAISKVYDHSLLSPGKNIELFLTRTSKKRQYKKNRKASTAHKKRRYELKSSMAKQESTAEVKEGTTYQPAVDLNPTTSSEATQEIPDATVPPTLKTVENGKNAFLYFDLETTGLGTSCDITQLACVTEEENFNRKIAQSGLTYQHLKMAYERGGPEGIENILSEPNSEGVVRVTRTKSVFAKLVTHFSF